MKRLLSTSTILLLAASAVAVAQPAERRVSKDRPYRGHPITKGQREQPALAKPIRGTLRLRDGAIATGLSGFYDYQSNGGSPSYLAVRRGNPDVLVTTFMISSDASGIDAANAARRVGYAYSADGGVTWTTTSSIFELRLGFPALQLDAGGRPFVAAHGDLGEGDRSFLFVSSAIGAVNDYYPLAELPLLTESGRNGGVAWPSFVLTKDGSKAIVVGSYSNDEDQPEAPLQVTTVSLADGATQARWRNLVDSTLSNTSGGRTVVSRAESGRIGVAWYKYQLDEADNGWGIYYTQSDDDGATWSTPVAVLGGERVVSDYNIDGDPDTLSAGANLDLAFRGDEPQVTFTGNVNGLIQFANVMFWSPSTGLRTVAMSNQVPGLGGYGIPLSKRQQNMGSIAYPTLSVGDDGRHVVVAFSAISQTADEGGSIVEDVVSSEGFQYYRVWGVGSEDGGLNWGEPFIIQDFAEKGTDSASIEYPSASETARVSSGTLTLPITYQARRSPGMYIYTGSGTSATEAGPMTETGQYFQNFTVTPSMFKSTAAADEQTSITSVRAELLPNRTAGPAALELTLPRAAMLDVSIVDALGRVVAHPLDRTQAQAGMTRVQIDASGLAAGLYHCVVRHDGGVETMKLAVER
jgi:hypothetical protein